MPPAAILALVLATMNAQQAGSGSVSGRITFDGSPVPGVTVTVTSDNVRRNAVTDPDGEYRLEALPPGLYRIEAQLAGFRREVAEPIKIGTGRLTDCSFSIRPGILNHVDSVMPTDGIVTATREADIIVHLRIQDSLRAGLLGHHSNILATEHVASILAVVKDHRRNLATGKSIRFWQDTAGEWIEDGQRIVGTQRPYQRGEEYVAFLKWDEQTGWQQYLGPHFMLRVIDGRVSQQNPAAPGIRDGMNLKALLAAVRKVIGRISECDGGWSRRASLGGRRDSKQSGSAARGYAPRPEAHMSNRPTELLLRVFVSFVLLTARQTCAAQDFINDNPEFKRMYLELSKENREYLEKYLASLSPEDRNKFMDHAVEMDKKQITVEHVYAKHQPASTTRPGLTVTPLNPNAEPLTQDEIRQLERMKVSGELRIVGIGVTGRGPKVRIILVMHKQVLSPVEVALPPGGTLIIVQTDNEWLLHPAGYERSQKTVRVQPSFSGRHNTSVDYDIGIGRAGSDAFSWP